MSNWALGAGSGGYALLNDLPVDRADEDMLGMGDTAAGIATMLIASAAASPFVVAVDAGWGMGKSTLLRQIETHLEREDRGAGRIRTVWFNAWTAESDDALEGLIKSVLEELDRNIVRKWVRKARRRRRLLSVAGIGLAVAGRFLGVARLVDDLWSQLSVDAQSRNKLRSNIGGMLTDWTSSTGDTGPRRCMVVFVDDLDRCSDDVVVKVCEAVKLYLDAPGLIFVLACDQSVLARGVAASARGGAEEGRSYLEKILQVVYRVPPPDDAAILGLIKGYARRSHTEDLITDQVATTLSEGTGRNPRKIKRIINSFILECQLSPAWQTDPLSSQHLITAVLLQHLYPSFYDLLVSGPSGLDPIGELLEYSRAREYFSANPDALSLDPYQQFFKDHEIEPPHKSVEAVDHALKRLERKLPDDFPSLAGNTALLALLRGLGNEAARQALRAQLFHHPLVTESVQPAAPLASPDSPWVPPNTPSPNPWL